MTGVRRALLFPGQASQYVGMGLAWYRASMEARTLFERANALLGYPLSALCFEGALENLNRTEYTQPAVVATSLAMWAAVRDTYPDPVCIAGHSVGEFTALVVAGVLDFEDVMRLVSERGRLMAAAGRALPGGMAALLGATPESAVALCAEVRASVGAPLVVANDNCPGQVVISGALPALEAAMARAGAYGIRRAMRLEVSVAPHSPLMAEAQGHLSVLLAQMDFRSPQVPLVFNVTATPLTKPHEIRRALEQQLTSPVRWRESLLWMAAQGVTEFVEIGPQDIVSGMVRRTLPEATVVAVDARQT